MNDSIYFYIPEGCSSATKFYVDIIKDVYSSHGLECKLTDKLADIPYRANVVTIRPLEFLKVWLTKHPKYTLTWFQGLSPEEIKMEYKPSLRRFLKIPVHEFAEKLCLKVCDVCLFVSDAMRNHYIRKYGIIPDKSFIMPCFNMEFNENLIRKNPYRYERPTFVYAGNLSSWQCFKHTLKLYKKIKDILPDASLRIYTHEIDKALSILKEHNVDAKVDCVSAQQLSEELADYKYGFIVRDDIVVNNVATPTKMNSYMSSGLIPVYSDVIEAYKQPISGHAHVIPFLTDEEAINKILHMEQTPISVDKIVNEYGDIFSKYWNRNKYIEELSAILYI